MSKAFETARRESSGWRQYVLAGYYLLTMKFSLTTVFIGVAMIGFGAVFEQAMNAVGWQSENVGIYAGFFGIWGTTLVLMGLIAYGIFFANKKYAELTADES